MATKYYLPEEAIGKRLRSLGKEVEMKTFKTNLTPGGETRDRDDFVKIICVGDMIGQKRKSIVIEDYCQIHRSYRRPTAGVDFHFKTIRRQTSEAYEPMLIKLQFWEMAEQERFSDMPTVYYKGSHGAIVFWEIRFPSSLEEAIELRQDIREYLPTIPCVLVTANTVWPEPLEWIGPEQTLENEATLDQFCKDHGFVDHFEIKSRNWQSGENSVFGQAVNCLLDGILQSEQKEEETWM